jgi:hypothetical protein
MYDMILNSRKRSAQSFRDKIFEQAEYRRHRYGHNKSVNRVNTIDGKIVFVSLKQILPPQDQLRKGYNQSSIDELLESLRIMGR